MQEVAGAKPAGSTPIAELSKLEFMFYTIYKTTHTATGRCYIGAHQTLDLADEYLGSGKRLANAIKKYGRDAFTKEVLFVFDGPEAMHEKEVELVTEEFVARDDTFNLIPGGTGGWWKVNRERAVEGFQELSNFGHRRQAELAAADPHFRDNQRRATSQRQTARHRAGLVRYDTFTGRQHSEEAKLKMSASKKVLTRGPGNPQYGKSWISRQGESPRMVSASALPEFLASGWVKGKKTQSWGAASSDHPGSAEDATSPRGQ